MTVSVRRARLEDAHALAENSVRAYPDRSHGVEWRMERYRSGNWADGRAGVGVGGTHQDGVGRKVGLSGDRGSDALDRHGVQANQIGGQQRPAAFGRPQHEGLNVQVVVHVPRLKISGRARRVAYQACADSRRDHALRGAGSQTDCIRHIDFTF